MKLKLPVLSGTIILSSVATTTTACSVNPKIASYCKEQAKCDGGLSEDYGILQCETYLGEMERKAKYFSCEKEFNNYLSCIVKNAEEPVCRSDYESRSEWEDATDYGNYGYYGYYNSNSSNWCETESDNLGSCIEDFYYY